MYICAKMKTLPSMVQKLSPQQTDRQIDRLKLLPTAYTDGIYVQE